MAAYEVPVTHSSTWMLAGGAIAIAGSFMPWATITSTLLGSTSISGVDDGRDGIITAAIALGVMALALFTRRSASEQGRAGRVVALLALIGAAAIVLIAILDGNDTADMAARLETSTYTSATVGVGLYVVGAGGLICLVGAVVALTEQDLPALTP